MIRYTFLNDTPVETLHRAFLSAFADYQVDMQASLDDFKFRLRRDGVDSAISVGAFDEDQLVGFCLNGSGMWQGESTVYDAGTGVLPGYRGQGVGSEMFRIMNPQLKECGFNRYLLEVLTSNKPAVNLYRRLGFEETRRFAVFRTTTRLSYRTNTDAEIRLVKVPNWKLYQTFWTGYPSWQNSIAAAQRVADTMVAVECQIDHHCVGYGVVSKITGNVCQLAVDESFRRRGVASMVLAALQNSVTSSESIKVTNVDETLNSAMAFFSAVGFKLVLEQHEMILNL